MHDSWKPFLKSEFNKPYFKELSNFLHEEYKSKTIYPPKQLVFSAFATDLNSVKVVVLGQDPYHTPGAAMGLAFSVPSSEKIPPSLQNIYKELKTDYEKIDSTLATKILEKPRTGSLLDWQRQGVLLLNTVLTVEAHKPASHRGHGWEIFTTETIKYLNETRTHLVFILWGRDARNKKSLIDPKKHLILESAHPSPLSANHGFFGSRPFSKTNTYLKDHGYEQILW